MQLKVPVIAAPFGFPSNPIRPIRSTAVIARSAERRVAEAVMQSISWVAQTLKITGEENVSVYAR